MNLFTSSLSDISHHRDLRYGFSLVQFQKVVNDFSSCHIPTVKLGKLITLEYGDACKEEVRTGTGYPVVGSNGIVGYHSDYLIDGPCIIVGRKGSAGEVTFIDEPCFPIDTTFYVKQKTDDYDLRFLYYVLRLLKMQRLSLFKGVPGLNRYDAYEAKVPLVSKLIQNKILRKVGPIEKQIADLTALICNPTSPINNVFAREFGFDLEQLAQHRLTKVLKSSITGFANNRDLRGSFKFHCPSGKFVIDFLNGITSKKVKDFLISPIVLGASISPDHYDAGGECYYVSMASIKNWKFDPDSANKVTDDYYQNNIVKSIRRDDIIMARSGEGTIGKVALMEGDEEGIACDFTMRIRVKDCLPKFAFYYFATDFFQHLVYVHKKGLGNNTNIFPVQLREFPMLDVSTAIQERVIAEVQEEMNRQDAIKTQIEQKRSEIDRVILDAIINNASKT